MERDRQNSGRLEEKVDADIAAIDRVLPMLQGRPVKTARDRTVVREQGPLLPMNGAKNGRINTAQLIRETIKATAGEPFTLKELCAKARGIQPLANVAETTVAPQISKMAKDGELMLVSKRRGQVAAIYRTSNNQPASTH